MEVHFAGTSRFSSSRQFCTTLIDGAASASPEAGLLENPSEEVSLVGIMEPNVVCYGSDRTDPGDDVGASVAPWRSWRV